MPYSRQTLTDLRNQAVQDIGSANIADASGKTISTATLLQKAVLRVMAWVQAGFAYLHYGYLDYIALQATPWTATDEYAAGWGSLIGVTQKDAEAASGEGQFSGTIGAPVAAGTAVNRQSDGFSYLTTADATVQPNGFATLLFTATTVGAVGNSDDGTGLVLGNSVPGVNSSGLATGPITGGTDQEDPGAFKTRYLQEYAAPPQGGDRADYIEWAGSVPGVTRSWVSPNGFGAGTVVVYTMFDQAEAAHGGFPQGTNGVATGEPRDVAATGDLLTVANAILPLQPVTALVYSCAPIPTPVAFSIAGLGANNTAPMQTAIAAALADMFLRLGQVGGTINPQTGAAWPAIEPDAWYSAISAIPGLSNFTVPVPSAPITPTTGQLNTVGALSFAS